MSVANLLIVYHSQSGTTAELMRAVFEGAKAEPQVHTRLLPALEATTQDLLWCDGVIFGSPENLGYISGGLKDFFDRTFYPAQPHELNCPYGVVISAGNDGSNALRQLQRIVIGYPMKCVAEPLIVKGEVSPETLQQCRDLGQAMAAGLSLGIY